MNSWSSIEVVIYINIIDIDVITIISLFIKIKLIKFRKFY